MSHRTHLSCMYSIFWFLMTWWRNGAMVLAALVLTQFSKTLWFQYKKEWSVTTEYWSCLDYDSENDDDNDTNDKRIYVFWCMYSYTLVRYFENLKIKWQKIINHKNSKCIGPKHLVACKPILAQRNHLYLSQRTIPIIMRSISCCFRNCQSCLSRDKGMRHMQSGHIN